MNLVTDGTPISISSLSNWIYVNVGVKKDNLMGVFYYNIGPNGYLEQGIYERISTKRNVTLEVYMNSDTDRVQVGHIYMTVIFDDGSYDFIVMPMRYLKLVKDEKFMKINYTYTSPEYKKVNRMMLRILNTSTNQQLNITGISVDYDKSIDTNDMYDTKLFQDNVILYGLDADKPPLR